MICFDQNEIEKNLKTSKEIIELLEQGDKDAEFTFAYFMELFGNFLY